MSELSRRTTLLGGLGAVASLATADPAVALVHDANPGPERLIVQTPGAPRFGIHFDSADQLAAFTRYDYLSDNQPLLLGHRAGYYPDGPWPESALESAQNILATSPQTMVEIDLRMTKDGKCISMHDATMDRESTGKGKVSEVTAEYALAQNLVNNKGQVTQFMVREVSDFLRWGVEAGAIMWLDVKDATPEFTVDLIRTHKAEAQVIVSAYGLKNLAEYRKLAPELVYFIPTNPSGLPDAEAIHRETDITRTIGFAGYYVPDIDDSVTMQREYDAPMQIELNRYDEGLSSAELDARYYERVVQTGFRVICTNHYPKVAEILGLKEWTPKPAVKRRVHKRPR